MTWQESREKAFRNFPILDILAISVIALATLFGSFYDETMTFGFPTVLIVIGAILWFSALRQGDKTKFFYEIRITIASVLALIVTIVLKQVVF